MDLSEQMIELAGAPVFYLRAEPVGATVLYLHGSPTSADDWRPFLERSGGLAPDLLGFGRSSKAGNLEFSLPAYVRFLEDFLRATQTPEVSLVGHGWGGAIALAYALAHPDRARRVTIIDAIPLLPGFEWPRMCRRLRRPGVGELMMGATSRRLLARSLRSATVTPGAWSEERLDALWAQFDQGTQRAILRLHRSIDGAGLAAAGAGLAALDVPALVVGGDEDPWVAPSYAEAYARTLPRAELHRVSAAGHWPWLDRPALIDRVAAFASH
ncbi:MAG TPA: alpha/beta hydrolase [Solirubrobacteraceae bacterium]